MRNYNKMGSCELCGREDELAQVKIEGTTLQTCKECSGYGRVIKPAQKAFVKQRNISRPPKRDKNTVVLVENIGERVRKAREIKGLTQRELATRMAQKESLIQKIENNQIEPSIELTKKLEQNLNIILQKEVEEETKRVQKKKQDEMTIGDIITIGGNGKNNKKISGSRINKASHLRES